MGKVLDVVIDVVIAGSPGYCSMPLSKHPIEISKKLPSVITIHTSCRRHYGRSRVGIPLLNDYKILNYFIKMVSLDWSVTVT